MKRSSLVWMSAWIVGFFTISAGIVLLVDSQSSEAAQDKGKGKGKAGQAAARLAAALPADTKPVTSVLKEGQVVLRARFGSKPIPGQQRREVTKWDGSLKVVGATLEQIRLWQDDPRDNVEGAQWVLSTKHNTPWNSEERKKGHEALPLADTALVIELSSVTTDAQLEFETAQGNFKVALKDVPLGGQKGALNGLVQFARLANSGVILTAPTEDDYPAAAVDRQGRLYVAYVAFAHGPDFRNRGNLPEEPKSLDNLSQPTGGDQVLLLRLDGRQWSEPMAVTPAKQDVFRPAVAVDGSGRAWVFWTAKADGKWNLFARALQGERWAETQRLTQQPEPDLTPVAATDSKGRVWVAWQGFREGKSRILALRQDGEGFGKVMTVAEGKANCWSPAIAAAGDGQVAIAWDTYAKGDYDVYARVYAGEQWGQPVVVAGSLEAEMRAALTYDKANRLWIAYERAPEYWGKDWGAMKSKETGVPLYSARTVDVRVWADGKLWETGTNAADAFFPLAGPAAAAAKAKAQAGKGGGLTKRNIKLAAPRLAVDVAGRVWLAVRSSALTNRAPVGPWWYEHVTYFDGRQWSRDILCPNTDNILDNTPAMIARPDGTVAIVASTDGRASQAGRLPPWFLQEQRQAGVKVFVRPDNARWPDPVNNELAMAEVGPVGGDATSAMDLKPVEVAVADASVAARTEAADVARARAARIDVAGKTLRLWRGEFHRHTELSQDGTGDGMLSDSWRYALDAAALDWMGNGDHDNGGGREYSWWYTQKMTDMLGMPGTFTPMFTYERSCNYPDGHRNVVFAQRGVRTLPRLTGGQGKALDDLPVDAQRPHSPDTLLLYRYLEQYDGVCASHTSGTDMGTDWRDNDPKREPVVEIYQGCRQNYEMPGAPRSNTADHSIGGWRPMGFVSLALKKGYRLGFQASSDHVSTHISLCNCWVETPTREGILAALKARHVYGSTDNIVACVRCGDKLMGDEFVTPARPRLSIRIVGSSPLSKVSIIRDGNYVHTTEPNKADVDFQWTDMDIKPGASSYYYVRGEQQDGELVWVSPLWITYKP